MGMLSLRAVVLPVLGTLIGETVFGALILISLLLTFAGVGFKLRARHDRVLSNLTLVASLSTVGLPLGYISMFSATSSPQSCVVAVKMSTVADITSRMCVYLFLTRKISVLSDSSSAPKRLLMAIKIALILCGLQDCLILFHPTFLTGALVMDENSLTCEAVFSGPVVYGVYLFDIFLNFSCLYGFNAPLNHHIERLGKTGLKGHDAELRLLLHQNLKACLAGVSSSFLSMCLLALPTALAPGQYAYTAMSITSVPFERIVNVLCMIYICRNSWEPVGKDHNRLVKLIVGEKSSKVVGSSNTAVTTIDVVSHIGREQPVN